MEEKEKLKASREPLTWLDNQLEKLKFSYYDLARLYAHDKEQANSAISILSRYYKAVESYFQWLAWDKNIANNSAQTYIQHKDGTYEIGDVDLPDPKYEVPIKTQYRLLNAIDASDYYRMGLDAEFNGVVGSNADYQYLINMLWPDEGATPDMLNVNVVSLAIINTIRGINLDEESRRSVGTTEAVDAIAEISKIEESINRIRRKEEDYLRSTKPRGTSVVNTI